jgi:uncharacterized protein YndB with AHSA1/START domain/uncharacterized protein YciI
MKPLPPLHREVLVESGPQRAFEVFTEHIGDWWPLAAYSVHGESSSLAFEDGEIVERSASGEVSVWGTVTRWEPPSAIAFTWHPGRAAGRPTQVTVTFAAAGGQTLVTLEHGGWENTDDPAAARAEYDHGWPDVLHRYRDQVSAPADSTWVALLHRPGPDAVAAADGLFQHPRFRQHTAFLHRMHELGYLVAAGPLADENGAGMTILRLRGRGRLEEATRLATEEDQSVASGFFTVQVRPWQVMLRA